MRPSVDRVKSKPYTKESGYAVTWDQMDALKDISSRGICCIVTSNGSTGTGALYELFPDAYVLMTNHHVISTTEVAEVIIYE